MNRTFADRYRGGVGMLAWLLHRLSGLALSAYLLLHIYDLRAAQRGAQAFDEALAVFQTPFWKVMDLLLLAAVLYHGLNGLRLLAFDAGWGIRNQRQLFWIALVVTIGVLFFSAAMTFSNLPTTAGS
ncbi:MAG TPA: succinate dehydrogenase, cytochrome b556 subunit [Herpetosiphonaceae bacterium]